MQTTKVSLQAKSSECDALRASLQTASSSSQALQAQYSSVKSELEQTVKQLKSEVVQNTERKAKVREYLGTLTAEKATLEASIQSLEAQLRDATAAKSIAIHQQQLMAMRIATVQEQATLEKETLQRDHENAIGSQRLEIQRLQNLVDAHAKGAEEQVALSFVFAIVEYVCLFAFI